MIVALIVALIATLVAFALVLWRGVRADGPRTSRSAVAAASEKVPPRLADIIEEHGALVADVKNLRRQWADFESSWERRWGTLTRAARRERGREEPEPVADSPDPGQGEFPLVAPPPAAPAPGERRHLRPARLHLGH